MRLIFTVLFFFSFVYFNASASVNNHGIAKLDTLADEKFPTPAANHLRLFYLQRDPNTNTVAYDIVLNKNGEADEDDGPVHAYWLRYTDKGQREELNFIQRKFAYGLNIKNVGKDKYDIRFVSYKKIPLTLMKGSDGKYHIFVTISKRQVILNRIFIRINGGAFWSPNVIYVEFKGTDISTGKEITERFKP
ncbi:hypothetical protein GCM10023149_39990 [Mucilaginibacter gynuensis]|uniref:DUF4833 domain-containing protein n=1 Tax=Mucilaginibacter gynuensis TaxID=1302236 RepID=A0ABP8H2R6_9SPHI